MTETIQIILYILLFVAISVAVFTTGNIFKKGKDSSDFSKNTESDFFKNTEQDLLKNENRLRNLEVTTFENSTDPEIQEKAIRAAVNILKRFGVDDVDVNVVLDNMKRQQAAEKYNEGEEMTEEIANMSVHVDSIVGL